MLGAFGARGELRVRPLSRFPRRFHHLDRVYVGESYAPAAIVQRRRHGNHVLLHLDAVTTRDDARALQGVYLYVPEAQAVTLPEGEYFVHQIIGLDVLTSAGEALGRVGEVLHTGSNDVYVVRGRRGEVLVPATKEVIKQIDLQGGTLQVELLPGLLDEAD